MKIALGQINTTVGDLAGNAARMVAVSREAAARGAELVAFHELSLTGYPPLDLIERPGFLDRTAGCLDQLARDVADLPLAVVCGAVLRSCAEPGKKATNSAVVLDGGRVAFRQDKMLLPTYDVFDEARYFQPAARQTLCTVRGHRVALSVCEDGWNDKTYWDRRLYQRDPVEELLQGGDVELLLSVNSSPYHLHKRSLRRSIFESIARRYGVPVGYVHQVGGNDQLVFDGSSFALDRVGRVIASARSFAEDLIVFDAETGQGDQHEDFADECDACYEALVLGTRDYLRKCGFGRVLIGLSGGIDSSLVACVAVDAVGEGNVIGVAMPGPFSSDHSLRDAAAMADRLGVRFEVLTINPAYDAFLGELGPVFHGLPRDVTEENVQSRLRGMTLMALSNKFNALVLTTGNKSELAVGYCTLYGDMCGGLAVISDVPKTMVYSLCRVANRRHPDAIPESVFTKPPSAELRPDQKDTDSLPDYAVLDAILHQYVEEQRSPADIAAALDLPLPLVQDIAHKVDRNEYKRQQAAPGLKVTTKAFGIGRRVPIAQRFVA